MTKLKAKRLIESFKYGTMLYDPELERWLFLVDILDLNGRKVFYNIFWQVDEELRGIRYLDWDDEDLINWLCEESLLYIGG